ncbi:MAG TPA: DUF3089 domain-containing protein [Polyangiales bacterium]|nr:DUF3089 domain-containing protein [Polyangiales bacterium]
MAHRVLACLLLGSCVIACSDDDPAEPNPGKDAGTDAGSDAGGGGGLQTLNRSRFTDVGVEGRLDYATPEYWVCRPDISPNECARNLDSTELKADGTQEVVKHIAATDPALDCFYTYPTVWLNRTAQMTDFSDTGVNFVLDPLLSQAARFSSICRVFVPLYRQTGLSGIALAPNSNKDLALQDVRDAFAYYLEHYGEGRRFVLLSHSQGSYITSALIKRDIDENPELRARMISAVMLGGQPYTPASERFGGSFKNIPACRVPGELGCVIAFNSYAKEAPATSASLFGHVIPGSLEYDEGVDPNGQVICTEPAGLAGNPGRYAGSYFPVSLHNPQFGAPGMIPGIDTPFLLYRDFFRGTCVQTNGVSYLEVSADPAVGDVRQAPAYRNALLEGIGFGMHLVDYNIPLDDVIAAVKLQAQAAAAF